MKEDLYSIKPQQIIWAYRTNIIQREAIRSKDKSYMTKEQVDALGNTEDRDTARQVLMTLELPPKSSLANAKDEKIAAYAQGYNQAIEEIEKAREQLL